MRCDGRVLTEWLDEVGCALGEARQLMGARALEPFWLHLGLAAELIEEGMGREADYELDTLTLRLKRYTDEARRRARGGQAQEHRRRILVEQLEKFPSNPTQAVQEAAVLAGVSERTMWSVREELGAVIGALLGDTTRHRK